MLVQSVLAGAGRVGRRVLRVIHALLVVRRTAGRRAGRGAAVDGARRSAGGCTWSRCGCGWSSIRCPARRARTSAPSWAVLDAVRDLAEDAERIAATVPRWPMSCPRPDTGGRGAAERRACCGGWPTAGSSSSGTGATGLAPTGAAGVRARGPAARPPDRAARRSRRRPDGPLVVVTRADARAWCCARTAPTRWSSVPGRGEHRFVGLFTAAGAARARPGHPGGRAAGAGGHPPGRGAGGVLQRPAAAGRDRPAAPRGAVLGDGRGPARDRRRRAHPGPEPAAAAVACAAEPYGRFFSCLVHLPQDRYSPRARAAMQRVLLRELDGWRIDHTVDGRGGGSGTGALHRSRRRGRAAHRTGTGSAASSRRPS